MAVRYRFGSAQPWVVVQGDRWETNLIEAKCKGANIRPRVYLNFVAHTYTPRNDSYTALTEGDAGTEYVGFDISNPGLVTVKYRRPDGSIQNRFNTPRQTGYFISATYARIEYFYNNFLLPQPWFQNTPQNSCTLASCNFKVFLGQQETLNITQSTCPQAEIVTNQCPPNTCDVLCGNTICCYNADGISVFNYPNT
jgi:hypothetical protein